MSSLSYMDKLLDGVEVEWRALGKVTTINTGQKPSDVLDVATAYDYINAGTSRSGYSAISNCEGDTVTTPSRGQGGIGYVGYQEQPFWLGPLCYKIKSLNENLLINKYLFYFLQSRTRLLLSLKKEGGVPAVNKSDLAKLEIPVPPLKIQAEIVRILDAFTELTAEIVSRKQQYSYYREQLLTFKKGKVEWKSLDEVANFSNGKGHEKDISTDGRYIVVNSKFISTDGNVAKYSDKQICPLFSNDILIVMSDLPNGKALAKTFFVEEDEKYTLNQRIGGITVKDDMTLLPKFLYYYLNRTPQLLKHDDGASQTNLRKGQILEVKIPVPPLAEQKRIVAILDKFDTLTTSLTEGLPREIALRQQQYEYYRELLLRFPQTEVADHD